MPPKTQTAGFPGKDQQAALQAALKREREATEAKSRFLAGVSHEFPTPLNGIIGFAELLCDGKVGPVSPLDD